MCGRAGKLNITEKPLGSHPRWWVQCWVCPDGSEYTDALRDVVGVAASLILDDPIRYLAQWLTSTGAPVRTYAQPPSEDALGRWQSALLASPDALRYLLESRGLTLTTISRYELGYDIANKAVTFPIRDEVGLLVNVKRRSLPPANVRRGLRRPAALYPMHAVTVGPRALVLCEGEFDVLLLNQHGIPAVTGTAGTAWKAEWNRWVEARYIAVLYDAGSHELATKRAAAFRAAGARDAWPVDLTREGFAKGEDVTDWFVRYRRNADQLRAFINDSRRWFRHVQRGARHEG